MRLFNQNQPRPNASRWRLSGVAKPLTFGAETGRGSDLDKKYAKLIQLIHQVAQSVVDTALPNLGLQIRKLEQGQVLNQHRDYHNHSECPKHIIKFGKYTGGSLQMLRDGVWRSYDNDNVWLSFDALKVSHRVVEVIAGN